MRSVELTRKGIRMINLDLTLRGQLVSHTPPEFYRIPPPISASTKPKLTFLHLKSGTVAEQPDHQRNHYPLCFYTPTYKLLDSDVSLIRRGYSKRGDKINSSSSSSFKLWSLIDLTL